MFCIITRDMESLVLEKLNRILRKTRDYELFREVELLTPEISKIEDIRYISYSELCELLNNPCGSPMH